jgi:Domain of unknown function (DUF5753)
MAAQLDRIIETMRANKATVQIIPFDYGAYEAADSMFVLLEFDRPELPPVVYVEALTTSLYYERPSDLDRYREAVEYLRDSALSPRDSLHRLEDKRKTYLAE